MKYAYGTLLRFIDLGLLLLMAFLAVAGLGDTFQAPLSGMQSGGAGAGSAFRILLDGSGRFEVAGLPEGSAVCRPEGTLALAACMRRLAPSNYVVAPSGSATVQHVVDVLDVCKRERSACALASGAEEAHDE